MANFVTGCRVVCGLLMLCFPAFSAQFYILYLLGGVTDMVDGAIARRTHTASAFGARLDTAADLLFAVISLFKLLPVLDVPRWLWLWAAAIAAIKLLNVISGFVCRKKWVVQHTFLNKLAGLALFLLPLTVSFLELRYSGAAVCSIATLAAVQEGHLTRTGKEIA